MMSIRVSVWVFVFRSETKPRGPNLPRAEGRLREGRNLICRCELAWWLTSPWVKRIPLADFKGMLLETMDWFKGKSTGNHRFSHGLWGFPVNFPLSQSIDENIQMWQKFPPFFAFLRPRHRLQIISRPFLQWADDLSDVPRSSRKISVKALGISRKPWGNTST